MDTIRFSTRAKVITIWIVLIVALAFLYLSREVVLPFFWAMLTAYIFHPLTKVLADKTRVPRALWIILLYLCAGALLAWAIAVLVPLLGGQYQEFVKAVPGIVSDIQEFVQQNSRIEIYGFSIDLQLVSDQVVALLGNLARILPGQLLVGVQLVFETVFSLVIYLVATFHLLLFGDRWAQGLLGLLPPPALAELIPLFRRINTTVSAYLRAQLIRIAFVSVVLFVGLTILQVRFALVLALVGGVLDIIPILGPNVSAGVTILVTLVQQPPFGWSHITLAIVIIILYLSLNQLEENIILPPLIGYLVDLPPLLVLFAVLAGERIAGMLGLLLAVPIAASLKIVLRYLYAKLTDKPVVYEEILVRRKPRPWRRRRKKEGKEETQ